MTPTHSLVLYFVNERDEVVTVNGAWNCFARSNRGQDALGPHVHWKTLWDFIADPTTRDIYRRLLARVRAGARVSFLFRCDGPAHRRLMRMSMHRTATGLVEFRSRMVREHPRRAIALLDAGERTSAPPVRSCGWCRRIAVSRREWVDAESAVEQLGLDGEGPMPPLAHGVCPECRDRMLTLASAPHPVERRVPAVLRMAVHHAAPPVLAGA